MEIWNFLNGYQFQNSKRTMSRFRLDILLFINRELHGTVKIMAARVSLWLRLAERTQNIALCLQEINGYGISYLNPAQSRNLAIKFSLDLLFFPVAIS
jgi:hypothetical protein